MFITDHTPIRRLQAFIDHFLTILHFMYSQLAHSHKEKDHGGFQNVRSVQMQNLTNASSNGSQLSSFIKEDLTVKAGNNCHIERFIYS